MLHIQGQENKITSKWQLSVSGALISETEGTGPAEWL